MPVALIVLLVFAFLLPVLAGWLGIFFDDYYETFTRLFFNARSVQRGSLPLWDPHTFAGGRINFIPNTRIWYWPLYPFYLLTSLRSVDSGYLGLVKIPLLFHWLVCALTAYGLGRKVIRLNPAGNIALSLVYSFGAAMSYNICDPGTMYPTVWLPLALWGIVSFARSGSKIMGVAGALALGFIGPCGSDVRGIFNLVTIALCVALLAMVAFMQRFRGMPRRLLFSGAVIFLIGLLISGPYWIAMGDTIRIYRDSPLLQVSRSASEMFSMPWRHLLTLLVPDLFGTLTRVHQIDLGISDLREYSHIEGNITGGFWLIMLCLVGSYAGWRRRQISDSEKTIRRWWIVGFALFVFSLLLITGRYSPVYRGLSRLIPIFGLPYAVRWRIMAHLGLALVAGVSTHWLWTFKKPLSRSVLLAVLFIVIAAVIWQWCQPSSLEETSIFNYAWTHYRQWLIRSPGFYLLAAVALTILLVLLSRKSFTPRLIVLAAIVEIIVIGFSVVYFLSYADVPEWVRYRAPSESKYYQWTAYPPLTNLPAARTGPERTTFYFSMLDQVATLHGGDYLMGHCSKPLAPRLLKIFKRLTTGYPYALRIINPASDFFPNMSVRCMVLNSAWKLPDLSGRPQLLSGTDGLYSHCLRDTMPRAFSQNRIIECSEDEAEDELMNGDLRQAVFIDYEDSRKQLAVSSKQWEKAGARVMTYQEFRKSSGTDKGSSTSAEAMADRLITDHFNKLQKINEIKKVWCPTPNRMNIDINVQVPAFLITTDVFYPGWRVKVDGQNKDPLRVNYLQRGVWLNRGRHTVEWVFRPPAVKWGFACIGLGLIGLLGLLIWPRRKPFITQSEK